MLLISSNVAGQNLSNKYIQRKDTKGFLHITGRLLSYGDKADSTYEKGATILAYKLNSKKGTTSNSPTFMGYTDDNGLFDICLSKGFYLIIFEGESSSVLYKKIRLRKKSIELEDAKLEGYIVTVSFCGQNSKPVL